MKYWICSECRHGNHAECKGRVAGDICVGHDILTIAEKIVGERYDLPTTGEYAEAIRSATMKMVREIATRAITLWEEL